MNKFTSFCNNCSLPTDNGSLYCHNCANDTVLSLDDEIELPEAFENALRTQIEVTFKARPDYQTIESRSRAAALPRLRIKGE